MAYVVDASALLALLKNEPGADLVRTEAVSALVSAVNSAEIWSRVLEDDENGLLPGICELELDALGLTIVPFDQSAALATAELRPLTRLRGLSLGDRACLALARERHLPVLTADRSWAALDLGLDIQLIR